MKRLIFLFALASSLAGAVTVTTTATQGACTGSICQWSATLQVVGFDGNLGPIFADLYEIVPVAGSLNVSLNQVAFFCGVPTHCQITSNGAWQAALAVGPGAHKYVAVAYQGNGTPLTPDQCYQGNACQTPGDLIAVSPQITTANSGAPPPPVQSSAAGCSAASITYGGSLTDAQGNVWTVQTAPRGGVLVNGQSAAGVWGSQVACSADGITYTNQDNGYVQCWTGSGWKNC
jgi:hypothetical protein